MSISENSNIGKPVTTPQAAANFYLERAKSEKHALSPLKLMKLVYIGHGWVLATLNQPLFDEQVEAWMHGPVIPSIYHEFKQFGSNPITRRALEFDFDSELFVPTLPPSGHQAEEILQLVWTYHKNYSGSQLRDLTHLPGSPWAQVYQQGVRHIEIPQSTIRDYYYQELIQMVSDAKEPANVPAAI